MAIKRGTKTIKRRHAKNFINEQAQRRLDEVVEPFNKQVENSVSVDAVEIDYYQIQQKVGIPCTCEETAVDLNRFEDDSNIAPVIPTRDSDNSGMNIRMQDDGLFGDSMAERIFDDEGDRTFDVSGGSTSFQEMEAEGDDFAEGLMGGGSINCGICYRTGLQPGYKAYGKQRFLFTNHNIGNMKGYFVNTTEAPHTMERHHVDQDGFVGFELTVPKYFVHATYSIRDNLANIASARLYHPDGNVITAQDFRLHAGHTIMVCVKEPRFTHVVVEFKLDVPPLLANISPETMALDYGRLVTIGDISVVLPPYLSQVENGDILVIKKRNLALKVRDKERKITASSRQIGWRASTRVLQPTEPLRNIADGFKLY